VTRWSRRDRLAVVVVATIVALLVGSTLVVVGIGAETEAVAAQLNASGTVTTYDSPDAARAAADRDAIVVPLSVATAPDGTTVTVAGSPPNGTEVEGVRTDPPPAGSVALPPRQNGTPANQSVSLAGPNGTVQARAMPRTDGGTFPPWWAIAAPSTVESLGTTAALLVEPAGGGGTLALRGPPPDDVPLTSALAFFVAGTDQLVQALFAVTVGVGLLAVVVVFSVTRMTVRDRLETLAILRATGLSRYRLLALFGARAGLLTLVAVGAGAAAGVVLTNAAVNAAVFAGVPTTLSLRVTPAAAGVLGLALSAVFLAGIIAGLAAVTPAVRRTPAAMERRARTGGSGRVERAVPARLSGFTPDLLATDAVVPTALTLAVFVGVGLVATATVGTLAPLAATDEATVVQSGTNHPWVSRVDADYARTLREEGTPASGEILLFSVVDGDPFLARGAAFDAFATLSDARLVSGRAPDGPGEAVVGRDLSRTTGIEVGDTVPLGGSDRPGYARVRVVGAYRASGVFDDHLVVPLATARHLSNVGPGDVNLVRVARAPDGDGTRPEDPDGTTPGESGPDRPDGVTPTGDGPDGLSVTDLTAPSTVAVGENVTVNVTVASRERGTTGTVAVRVGDATRRVELSVDAGATVTRQVSFAGLDPGSYTVSAGGLTRDVQVVAARSLRLSSLPRVGPPNATVLVTVRDADGDPLGNATVAVTPNGAESPANTSGGSTARTGTNGRAAVALPSVGTTAQTVTVTAGASGYVNASQELTVDPGASRGPVARLRVSPSRVEVFERPEATLELANRWNGSRSWWVDPPGGDPRQVSVAAGEQRTVTTTLSRVGSGTRRVTATVDGRTVAAATYRVTGDGRLVSALATGDRRTVTSSGVGQAATNLLGNLWVVLASLVGLAALATVATTTTAFARTVHARRETIGIRRATGATRWQVLRLVLGDAVAIAVPATALALAFGYAGTWLLARTGVLTAFGVSLAPSTSLAALAGLAALSLALALAGAALATLGLVLPVPARTLTDDRGPPTGGGDDA